MSQEWFYKQLRVDGEWVQKSYNYRVTRPADIASLLKAFVAKLPGFIRSILFKVW